jgi:hypothetical protein
LPFVAAEIAGSEESLCNVQLSRAIANAVECSQHALCPRALLGRYPGVRRDGAAMNGREQTMDGLEPVETVDVERYDGRDWRRAGCEQLNLLAVAKLKNGVDALLVDCLRPNRERKPAVTALDEDRWRRRQDNDTGVVLR